MLAALGLAAVSVAPAQAVGSFDVTPNACDALSSWASNGWSNGIYCDGYSVFQLNSNAQVTVGPPGTFMWRKSPRLPDATYLKALKLTYLASQASGPSAHILARGCQRYAGQNDAWSGAPNGACVGATFDLPAQSGFTSLTVGESALSCSTNCGGWQLNVSAGYTSGFVWISGLTATVGDDTAPTVSSQLATHSISQGKWLRGTAEIGATGVDANGSGIASMAFYPGDPMLTVSTSGTCNFTQWIPCAASKGWTGSFDTSSVSDGPHSGYYTATDPAGRVGQSQSFEYKVDNTKPVTPSTIQPVSDGMNGWSSDNNFGATWTNGPEVSEDANHSGLDKVIVDLDPAEPGHSNPAPVTVPIGGSASGISATADSISGVTVPEIGKWAIRLQLVDKAGNVSEVGDGSGNSPDSDISVGYDPNPPAAPAGIANGWISRDELAAGYDQVFTYSAPPTAKANLCGFSSTTDEDVNGTTGSSINVPGGTTRKVRLDGTLTETTHYVHIRAISCNGLASPTTNTTEAKVDRTDPVASIAGVENGKWYKDGQLVGLHATDALSGMAPADPGDPYSTSGAYLSYAINGSGPTDVDAPRGDTADIPITREGQKELRFSPVDLAGNKAAAKAVTFGIDATNPNGYINKQDSARPTLLSAHLTDAPSGVSYAIFSVRPAGGSDNDWIQLPTSLTGVDGKLVGDAVASGTATARFPDTSLGQGTYDVRVSAYDQAGNPLATQRYQDGALATMSNPMRNTTSVSVKLFKALRSCGSRHCAIKKCTKKSKGACYRVLKGKVVFQGGSTSVTSAFKRGAIATGVLTDASGKGIPNTTVDVSTTETFSRKNKAVDSVKTDANGIYTLRIPASVNRTVKVQYAGDELRRESSATARLDSQAKLKLKISTKHAKTGQTVVFSGKVTALDGVYPAGGKIVALQFYAVKKWRPAVAVGHTDKNGKFKIKYKFDGRKVKAKIVFRVVAPSEDGWGHAYSTSMPVKINLN
jgi:hypothetical protein